MSRIPHLVRVAALLFYVLEAWVLVPLHVLEESPATPRTPGFELGAACDPCFPCADPQHHHHTGPAHQADHCPACTLAARPATVECAPRLFGALRVVGPVWSPARPWPAARSSDHHAPRGPPLPSIA